MTLGDDGPYPPTLQPSPHVHIHCGDLPLTWARRRWNAGRTYPEHVKHKHGQDSVHIKPLLQLHTSILFSPHPRSRHDQARGRPPQYAQNPKKSRIKVQVRQTDSRAVRRNAINCHIEAVAGGLRKTDGARFFPSW